MLPPLHEQIISETRAVQEAVARLGPSAKIEEIQKLLECEGVHVSPEFIERVMADRPHIGQRFCSTPKETST
jgi:hypothetical protein